MTKYDFTQKGLDKLYNEFVTKIKKNKIKYKVRNSQPSKLLSYITDKLVKYR